ncbi:hypothetical protein [Enterococcus rivorum]|uniref:hypothetical protein n=1 Tax=Enterococcus rivorum TaxID=762845 RepID=UPI0036416D2E
MNTKKIMSVLNPKSLLLFVFLLGTLMFSLLSLSMAVVQASADSPTLALKVENKNEKFNVVVTDSLEGLVPKELPNQLEIALEIKGLEAYNQAEFLENLKIMKGNEELSFKKKGISKKFNEENPQQLLIQLSKEVVTKLIKEGTTSLTFKTQFTLNKDDKALLESLNGDKITFNFLASSNLDEENVEKTCDLAIALPTGKAIPQTVMEGSSSDSLVAADLVKELKPAFDFDQVEVVGIEEQQSFDKAGEATVPVTIKSRETNLTNKIEVPITVRQNAPVPFKPNPKAVVDRPFLKDPLTTFVDKFGKKVEGKEVDENLLKNIVVLAYLGSDWKKDVILSIAAENGGQEKKWNGTMKKLYENDYLIVDKVAYKNGQYLKAKYK